ncbi:uncharacterized protein LOC114351353 isoform X2 [Ostrinia furnacalis]|uniref:uncharacterized protein LOC114351353 isoform X2 n=1 Tax=Ostrinia furnacalis TaxID=93504 RepID=UPI00103CC7DE|nr:uncharacterized protein LOC114351353 isoform X2 [Ostrinia furnacalis]
MIIYLLILITVMYLAKFKSLNIPPFSWCFPSTSDDSYAVVSEYYGRGLFNKLTVVTDSPDAQSPVAPAPPAAPVTSPPAQAYGPGAEAKLRLQEGQSKQVFVATAAKQVAPKGTAVIPMPEGRMRVLEQQRYSSSLEANMNKLEPRVHQVAKSPLASPHPQRKLDAPTASPKNISSAIANDSPKNKNPFEEENYDESKNPFADGEVDDPTNPFAEDDYDKNLNPFS